MVDFIPSTAIDISSGMSRGIRRPATPAERNRLRPNRRADLNDEPSEDMLRTLVERAVQALRGGVYWDRGTILNLLV